MHGFAAEGADAVLAKPPEPPQPSVSMRGDPVLRLAMLKMGVIKEGDLAEAETWIRAAAEQGMAVVVEHHQYHLVSIEEWIKSLAGVG